MKVIGKTTSTNVQFDRLQRRLGRCIDDLAKISARLPSSDADKSKPGDPVHRRQMERDCICLEVALDEAAKWARLVLGRIEQAQRDEVAVACVDLAPLDALMPLDSLLHPVGAAG